MQRCCFSKKIIILFISITIILFCNSCKEDSTNNSCADTFFGAPNARTGLSSSVCTPICACKEYTSTTFTPDEIEALKMWKIDTPFALLSSNPYNVTVPESKPCVCAVVVDSLEGKIYHLQNYSSASEAEKAGAYVTHYDSCGLCSTLQDLAVYASNLDIGKDVKACGIRNLTAPFNDLVACIEALGFTRPCAQIWAYNTRNTQKKCLEPCSKNETYNKSNGDLSDCLACDEKYSGPVFKAVAGRTRRNTGIASSICRKCEEVQPVYHNYPR